MYQAARVAGKAEPIRRTWMIHGLDDAAEYMNGWTPESRIAENLKGYLDQYAETREILIRAKWSFDGAKTLAEAAQRLRDYADSLDGLAAIGFELRDEIIDDYGFIGRPDDGGPNYPEDDDDAGDPPIVA